MIESLCLIEQATVISANFSTALATIYISIRMLVYSKQHSALVDLFRLDYEFEL